MIHYLVYVNGKCVGITIRREFAEITAQRTGGQIIEEVW